jgi:hypothetical protein
VLIAYVQPPSGSVGDPSGLAVDCLLDPAHFAGLFIVKALQAFSERPKSSSILKGLNLNNTVFTVLKQIKTCNHDVVELNRHYHSKYFSSKAIIMLMQY